MSRRVRSLALLLAADGSACFKRGEMKRCDQVYFCRTARARPPAPSAAASAAVDAANGRLRFAVPSPLPGAATALVFSLSPLPLGGARLLSSEPGSSRHATRDVVMPSVEPSRSQRPHGMAPQQFAKPRPRPRHAAPAPASSAACCTAVVARQTGLCSAQCSAPCSSEQYHTERHAEQNLNCCTDASRLSHDGRAQLLRPCSATSARQLGC